MPPLGEALIPQLWFNSSTDDTIHVAYHDTTDSALQITKTLGTATGPTGFECSFAGGCTLEVTAEGLSSILKNDTVNNFISVLTKSASLLKLHLTQPNQFARFQKYQLSTLTSSSTLRHRRMTLDLEGLMAHSVTVN
jgi:hypothetical protein